MPVRDGLLGPGLKNEEYAHLAEARLGEKFHSRGNPLRLLSLLSLFVFL